jgi:hypothetical protein
VLAVQLRWLFYPKSLWQSRLKNITTITKPGNLIKADQRESGNKLIIKNIWTSKLSDSYVNLSAYKEQMADIATSWSISTLTFELECCLCCTSVRHGLGLSVATARTLGHCWSFYVPFIDTEWDVSESVAARFIRIYLPCQTLHTSVPCSFILRAYTRYIENLHSFPFEKYYQKCFHKCIFFQNVTGNEPACLVCVWSCVQLWCTLLWYQSFVWERLKGDWYPSSHPTTVWGKPFTLFCVLVVPVDQSRPWTCIEHVACRMPRHGIEPRSCLLTFVREKTN